VTAIPRPVTRADIRAVEQLFGVAGIGEAYVKNGTWEIKENVPEREQP